jgi:large exoprotein involved in heme utilization and adhesion
VAAVGDVSLLATDTVKIRDTTDTPFIAFAGDELLVQGNRQVDIVALSHLESGLFAGGDMVLRSAEAVGGDAHYWSGGDFRVETLSGNAGHLWSPVDPIIRSFGDVKISEYRGASLHILAGGSVNIGTAIINAPETGTLGNDFFQDSVTLSDGRIVKVDGGAQPTLDVRAGVAPEAIGIPSIENSTGLDSLPNDNIRENLNSSDITVSDIFLRSPNGLVFLTNQYRSNPQIPNGEISINPGALSSGGINTGDFMTTGAGGDIIADSSGNIILNQNILTSSVTGSSGDVVLISQDNVLLNGSDIITSLQGTGKAGDISIFSDSLQLIDGSRLVTNTRAQGSAGDVQVSVSGDILFEGENSFNSGSGIFAAVEETARGSGGSIEISANSLTLNDSGTISASSVGQGSSGTVSIIAPESVVINGEGSQFISSIASVVGEDTTGDGGNIQVITGFLSLQNGGQLTANMRGQGSAGNINVVASGSVLIEGESSDGDGSGIYTAVEETARGSGGSIEISANSLVLNNSGTISTGTEGQGSAGDIFIEVQDAIVIEGEGSEFVSAILSSVGEGGSGEGGDININSDFLTLAREGVISAQSNGEGNAGQIYIVVNNLLELNNGSIETNSTQNSGGEVQIKTDRIYLFGNSDIQTSVNAGEGSGGNILIISDAILAFNDSDILAFSADGQGGNITLNTPGFFGENYQPALSEAENDLNGNDRVDLNASGRISSGRISLPDISFIENNLSELADNLVNPETLVANSCIDRSETDSGTFRFTGSDRLPQTPTESTTTLYPSGTVQPIPLTTASESTFITEPQAIYQLPDGRLVMSRGCEQQEALPFVKP